MIATTGLTHFFGTIFQPIFHGIAWLLAELYSLIPNYAVAIALLTIIIMTVLTPLTVKSTKSMMAMQRLQPEVKKLQQKYKGPENRQLLNQELMALYQQEGVNPISGCLPMLIQMPFLAILYGVIKGLANTVTKTVDGVKKTVPDPRYIPKNSEMFRNLISTGGHLKAFGMDLALKPFSAHGSVLAAIPFFLFVAAAVGLQYFQMWQLNNRNRRTGQQIPQQALMMQRMMPALFAFFYLLIPAAVVLYMIVSTGIRIITQDVMFRMGLSDPRRYQEREIPGRVADVSPAPAAALTSGPPKKTSAKAAPTPPPPKSHPRSKSKRKRKVR